MYLFWQKEAIKQHGLVSCFKEENACGHALPWQTAWQCTVPVFLAGRATKKKYKKEESIGLPKLISIASDTITSSAPQNVKDLPNKMSYNQCHLTSSMYGRRDDPHRQDEQFAHRFTQTDLPFTQAGVDYLVNDILEKDWEGECSIF